MNVKIEPFIKTPPVQTIEIYNRKNEAASSWSPVRACPSPSVCKPIGPTAENICTLSAALGDRRG